MREIYFEPVGKPIKLTAPVPRHVVITSVNRDELHDGGASIFSECVRLIKEEMPDTTVEILIPDFRGVEEAFEIIMKKPPDILNHNLETVPRLYKVVRPQAKYERSLNLIKWFKEKGLKTKSGIIIPETVDQERPEQGKVIAVGEGRMNNEGKILPMKVKVGDMVIFSKYGPDEVKVEGDEYFMLKEENILAIIK